MFKRSRQNTSSVFLISQEYYEIPKRTIKAKENIYHNFKPNSYRGFQNRFQDKSSMDLTLENFKDLTCISWDKNKKGALKIFN